MRLLRDLPGGGGAYGGGGGAGPLSNEFPSYLFYFKSHVKTLQKLKTAKHICNYDM